jgi:hypothetical protein
MIVKFGGYDLAEAHNGITVLKTINDKDRNPTWGLLAKDFMILERSIAGFSDRHVVHFDPALPFMYVS